jgi:hypothetical protein
MSLKFFKKLSKCTMALVDCIRSFYQNEKKNPRLFMSNMVYYSKMGISVAARAAFIFLVISLVFACGELDTMFTSNGSYQVRTLVNGVPIEDCSIVRSDDKVRPYFAVSVADDPDLVGLLVYLLDSKGKISGGKVRYTVRSDADVIAETEKKAPEEIKQNIDEAVPEQAEGESGVAEAEADVKTEAEAIEEETVIAVKSFARELPYFPLSGNLKIGTYTLVFEVLGNRETLSRTETDIFYLGNAEFNLKDIAMYLPGLSDSQLISPGTTVLLETRLDFDARLDPYVIWYNGKNIISEGKISAGAGSILWVAPEQAGFYSLRLEAFPFQLKRNSTGVYRGIALPVSPKAVDMGYFFTAQSLPLSPELLQWYRFEGSLENSKPSADEEQSLLPLNTYKAPHWAGAGQSYGLSTGSNDVYQLPPVNFFRGKDKGGGILKSHIRLPAEGVIFSVFFPLKSSPNEGAWAEMISEGNIIALIINAGGAAVEIPVYLDPPELQGFIPVVTEFYVQSYRLEARITLGEGLKSKAGSISLPAALSGEGIIRMGGQEKFKRENRLEAPIPAATGPAIAAEDESADILETDEAPLLWMENRETNTIWDEFAILLSTAPFSSEEFVEKYPKADNARSSPVVITGMGDIIKEPIRLSVLFEDS